MRLWIVIVALLYTHAADAAPAPRCYAGTDVIDEGGTKTTTAVVIAWDADPAKHEVRERTWTEDEPVDRTRTYRVDADHKTLEADFHRTKITGTFDGDPWSWTGFHTEASVMKLVLKTDAKLTADTIVVDSHSDGPFVSKRHLEGKAFDCKELDRRVAALDALPAGAQRLCYDGTDTNAHGPEHVIVEQITEPKRLRVRHWSPVRLQTRTYAIDGHTLAPAGRQGSGTIDGKPGAWTGYKMTEHALGVDVELDTQGTLGGPKATETLSGNARGGDPFKRTIEATAFDCKDLARRRDAIRSEKPADGGDHHDRHDHRH